MLLLQACADPEAAPRDLDTLAHAMFEDYTSVDEEALYADVIELRDGVVDEDALPLEGTLTDLDDEVILAVGIDRDFDWSRAQGMYTLGFVDCTADEMERIYYSTEQDELYPDNYSSYDREYTSSFEDYVQRASNRLTWRTDYAVDILSYSAMVEAGQHYVPDDGDGPYLYSQTLMPQEAVTTSDFVHFEADFQIEAFYPHAGGMVHLFAMWRHFTIDGLYSTDDDGGIQLVLDNLHKFDDDTTAICDEGRVPD